MEAGLSELGCDFPEDLFYAWGGMPVHEIISTLNVRQGLQMDVESVAVRKENLYYEFLPRLTAVTEVLEVIESEHGRLPFAVVSGSTRESVSVSLESLKLLDKFQTLVCAGDYQRSKPDPEGFLRAAERLGIDPKNCLVFEDTARGIEAATAAGMASVKVLQRWERTQEC